MAQIFILIFFLFRSAVWVRSVFELEGKTIYRLFFDVSVLRSLKFLRGQDGLRRNMLYVRQESLSGRGIEFLVAGIGRSVFNAQDHLALRAF